MLTPAEFTGLSGMSLAGRVRQAFFHQPQEELQELLQRVVLGLATSQEEWDETLRNSLASVDRFVIQQFAPIPVYEFPVVGEEGQVRRGQGSRGR